MDASEFSDLSRSQAAKFKAYFADGGEYKTLYPPPVLQIEGLDWKFYGMIVTSVSTVIVAALRTAQMFYVAEELSSRFWTSSTNGIPLLGWTGAIFSMLAFEGGLAFISAVKTAEKEKVEDWVYSVQVGLLLTISIFAGIGQSLGLVKGISAVVVEYFSYFLILVVGVGASVAAGLSGEILGVLLQKYYLSSEKAKAEFKEQEKTYTKTARTFFLQKLENEKKGRTEQNGGSSQNTSPQEKFPRIEAHVQRTSARGTSGEPSYKTSLIFSELENARTEQNKVLSYAELSEVLRMKYPEQNFSSGGNISTKRTEWINSHPEYFEKEEQNEESA